MIDFESDPTKERRKERENWCKKPIQKNHSRRWYSTRLDSVDVAPHVIFSFDILLDVVRGGRSERNKMGRC